MSEAPQIFRRFAIAGNPNTGKSTIFNALTGLRQKVGNYPGVTVEKKTGRFFGSHGEVMELLDLPGSYSLQVRSPDEAVSRDVLLGRVPGTPRPEAIIAVLDASNLERHLYLVAQFLELEIPVIVALNMVDVAEQRGLKIDLLALKESLGGPVIPMVARRGQGLIELKQTLSAARLHISDRKVQLPIVLEREVAALSRTLQGHAGSVRPEALLLLSLEDERLADEVKGDAALLAEIHAARERLKLSGLDPIAAPVDARYAWVSEVCASVVHRQGEDAHGLTFSDHLDQILTHRVWGWVAFLGMMTAMFLCIFLVAKWPMDWISAGVDAVAGWTKAHLPDGDLKSLISDGVIHGVGAVVVFLPQILILFFFLGLLEDSGYMARAAFIMDRLMSRVGLHGKSFVPMLSSFACAIPGIMSTRTIENRKDRFVTILVAPLMSCSARLPVYALMIALLMPAAGLWGKAGLMLAMYLLGIVAAFGMAWLFKKTLLRSETPMLLLELPPYRLPALRGIVQRMWERGVVFLRRAGTVILALNVLLWALLHYPKPAEADAPESARIAHSFGGRAGKVLEPVIAPLGFDWKIGIGLVGSFAAREVFVSTMSQVYDVTSEEEDKLLDRVGTAMAAERRDNGTPVFTPLVCLSVMVFYVLAMQCLSTVAIVKREMNSWGWAIFQIAYMNALAWIAAFVVYQGGHLLGFR